MGDEKITYEVKLQPALLILLGVMVVGFLVNAFPNASPIQDAMARKNSGGGEMIAVAASPKVVWHMRNGEVRWCRVDSGNVGCTDWR